MEVRSDRTYRFGVEAGVVWDAIGRVEDYRRWWPWLRRFEARALEAGDRWRCTVRPPLPYALRFTVELTEVLAPRRIAAEVSGDIGGDAVVEIEPARGGCEVRLVSTLSPRDGVLRGVSRFAPRLARFGHDWVLDTGLGQFRRRALEAR